jgi:ubiquinone biosynthesis protein Coq4
MHKLIVQIRSHILVFLTHNMALPMLKVIRSPEKFPYTREDLHQLPAGTLGKELVAMLDRKQLKLLPYYEGEVCLQCFMLGNRHLSFPVAATVLYGIFTMPEYWGSFREAYQRGAQSVSVSSWEWFSLLDQPIRLLIDRINSNK